MIGDDDKPVPGEYVSGWIKRGPSGVIGTNKKDANDTVARILEDVEANALNEPAIESDGDEVTAWVTSKVPTAVTWEDWQRIDAHETAAGEPHGRPRVKIVRVEDMHDVVARASG